MEEKISLYFDLQPRDIKAYSPLALAYMGDGIYELIIRTILLKKGNRPANKLHRESVKYVSAKAQAAIMDRIIDCLSEEELSVYTRGRNAKPKTVAKSASIEDYHKATGFEALLGYLYLAGGFERILELVKRGIEDKEP